MFFQLSDDRDGMLLQVRGALDAEGALAIRPALENVLVGTAGNVVLDMAGVGFVDGSGVGAVAFLFKRLAAQGRRLTVQSVDGQPLATFRRLGLDRVLGLPMPPRRAAGALGGIAAAFGFARAA